MDVFIIRNAFWDISLRSIRVSNVVAHPRSCCFGSRLKLFFVCLFNAKNTGGTKAAPWSCSDLLNFHGTSRRRRAICLPPFERDGSRCFSREPSVAIPWRRDDWHVSHLSTGAARSRGEGGGGTWRKPPAVSGNLGTRGWGWDGGAPAVPLTSRCDLNSSRTTRTTLGPRWLLSVTVRMMAGLVFSSSNWILFFFTSPREAAKALRVSVERVFWPTKSL